MKNIIKNICSRFTRPTTYNATMIIAGQTVTVPVYARDYATAMNQAEIIVDDCGFVLSVEAA